MPRGEFPDPDAVDDLSADEAEDLVGPLREAIRRHDHRYYVHDDPEISAEEYDRLYEILQRIEGRFELHDEHSPTRRIGAPPVDSLPTVGHTAPMRSLDATRERADLERFLDRVRDALGEQVFVLEPKLDGASVGLVYDAGRLVHAATRSDGVRTVDEGGFVAFLAGHGVST